MPNLSTERLFGVDSSLSGRNWVLSRYDPAKAQALSHRVDGNDLLARLLAIRGVAPEAVENYLLPTLKTLFPDPSTFQDMEKAAALVADAILDGRPVTVFADYDVDGGTSSALLTRYFRAWGRQIGLYVPDRMKEGYGPSAQAFAHLKDQGQELVITVDCGAAAVKALEEAHRIGLDVIVIDHHLMHGDLPPSAALVNPNRPDDTSGYGHLAAAGVVYVFLAALNREFSRRGQAPKDGLPNILEWLDLCALGTLCDMSPLRDTNRAFVRQGLKVLANGQNVGLKALSEVSGIGRADSVYHATFVLGPRLNAGGRIGDPWIAAKLLATDDRAEAIALAEQMHDLNEQRKAVENEIQDAARVQAQKYMDAAEPPNVLVLDGEGWHPGVNGIVAGRIKDEFHLPTLVIGWGEGVGPLAKGSARSVKGVNIGAAIAEAAEQGIVSSGGGHAMAGGVSLEVGDIPKFRSWLESSLGQYAEAQEAALQIDVDLVLEPGAVDLALVESIDRLSPFGVGAPQPLVALPDVAVTGPRRIGANHLRFIAENATGRVESIAWRIADKPAGEALLRGGRFHLLGRLETNEWNNRRRVQLNIVDVASA